MAAAQAGFPAQLREWRRRRAASQLELAFRARVSQRHLSFLETGKAAPSREMVLHLAAALDLSLRQQNALLLAAGYAPIWSERRLDAPELSVVDQALGFMLAQQEPYPAFVVDRRWNVLRANEGARRFVGFLLDAPPVAIDPQQPINLADALLAPAPLRPVIDNWREVALYFLRSVQADALADGTDETAALLQRLLGYPDVAALLQAPIAEAMHAPVLAIRFVKGSATLSLFTTIATLGTPQDVTLQEIRIECFFPADERTASHFKA